MNLSRRNASIGTIQRRIISIATVQFSDERGKIYFSVN